MAKRPKSTWVAQIFNIFPNNGLPIGFVDVVYNKDGSIAGYEIDDKFYEVGKKPEGKKTTKQGTDPKKFGSDFAAAVAAQNEKMDAQRVETEQALDDAGDERTRAELRATVNNKQNYIQTLRNSLPRYEDVIERYAIKVARGDELDSIEQRELTDAQKNYASLMNTIKEVQQDIFETIYPNQKKSKVERTPLAAAAGPTGTPATSTATIRTTSTAGPTGATTVTTPPVTATPSTPSTPSKSKTPATPQEKPAPISKTVGSFDPGRFRMGEEASMGAAKPAGVTPAGATTGTRTLESILGDVQNYFDIPDYIFKLDKDLSNLLVRAVNEKWTTDRWDKEIELTNWYRKNNENVRQRLTLFGNYEDLRSQGEDVSKSDYGLWLSKKRRAIKADAQALAGVAITDQQADEIAKKIYLGFLDDDENAIRAFLVPLISKTTSIVGGKTITGFGGQALKDYQTLQSIAKANGFNLSQILPGISATTTGGDLEEAVLEKIALGELDVNRISQDARMMAAIGQPEFVRNLLNQGYDLDQVYAPYRNTMANVLELNAEQIDLNDPTLRSAISDKGEVNLYDFQRQLRKDSRWQYTQQARGEVSDVALRVLRDFGFQG
ncbi:MAG: hypothetical protein EBR82_52500 [Caulobacteraceae bacterium]|nr:hypothetical protein [Caulobacteraceae bacterium]